MVLRIGYNGELLYPLSKIFPRLLPHKLATIPQVSFAPIAAQGYKGRFLCIILIVTYDTEEPSFVSAINSPPLLLIALIALITTPESIASGKNCVKLCM